VSSNFVGLSSRPYLLASAVCQLPLLPPTTRQLHPEASNTSALSSNVPLPSSSVSTVPRSVSTTPPSTICVSTTHSSRLPLLASTTPYSNIFWKYSTLLKISTMSTRYGPRILGRCRPTHSYAIRDSGPQETGGGNFGHASPMSGLLMARNRKLYCEPYIAYLRPCNLDDDSAL